MVISKFDVDIESLEIKDVININLLQTFQDNFAESMDIASVTVDRNGNPVTMPSSYTSFCIDFIHSTTIGDNRCAEFHKKAGEIAAQTGKPYIYTCHAGLIDFAAPVLVNGQHIGTILGGQVLTKKPDELTYRKVAKEIGVHEDKFVDSVKEIKITTEKNLRAAAELLYLIANSLSKIGYEELELKNSSKLLEHEVSRTNLLLEESKRVNELMSQQLSILSHELKTPLNIIFGSVQLLESCYKDSPFISKTGMFSKYSGIMRQNCYRLTRLINNIVDMNKIELGFFSLQLKNNNIIKVIEDITLSVVEYASLKNISIVFDTEIEEKITSYDSEKIERIILNLLSNAIKFTEAGGNINVSIYDGEDYILISVKDNGIGIPKDMVEKIFDTYTQVDGSLRRNAEGSGIGLSIVKSLVEMHGGEITVISQLGIGSEFIIKMPINIIRNEVNLDNQEDRSLSNYVENVKIEFSDVYV
jgi:signal transduction histidine kinase